MTTRRRTAAEKAQAVGIAVVEGTTAASEKTGIPRKTIAYWRDQPEFAELRQQKKEDVAADVWAAFQAGVRRVAELIPLTDDLQKVATATGIIYDKFALMAGHATSRSEHRELLADFDDHEREAVERWLHDLAKERADAPA